MNESLVLTVDGKQVEAPLFVIGSLPATQLLNGSCPYAGTVTAYSIALRGYVLCALPCKRWGCKTCGPRKARALAFRVEEAKPNRFITLTIAPELFETPRAGFDRSRRMIAELAKVLRKRVGEFEYVKVLEVHKSGFPHYHLLARSGYIPHALLKEAWKSLTDAFIVDIRRIDKGTNVFKYMIKYLCKQSYIPWTNRRCSWTRNFFPEREKYNKLPLKMTEKQRWEHCPSVVANEQFPGREIVQLTPTCFLVSPSRSEISWGRQQERAYEYDLCCAETDGF